jgi:signal peptidase II
MPPSPLDSGDPADTDTDADDRSPAPRRLIIVVAVAAFVIAVDQLTKWWALNSLQDGPVDVVWTLRWNLVFNSGASFSMGDGMGPVIGVVALVVVGVLLWTGRTVSSTAGAVALGMILGGALGNLIDRAFRAGDGFMGGAVVDFIDVQWWPVWNVADMGVVLGAILLLVVTYRNAE